MNAWFDAHLDLACLAECGRDLSKLPTEGGGPFQPGALSWPTMVSGGVRACLGTIFTESGGTDEVGYAPLDVEGAHARGVAQLERYHAWHREGVIRLEDMRPSRGDGAGTRGMNLPAANGAAIRLGILMECADPIRRPDELGWWVERGVSVIGLAWGRGSRYAAGNAAPGPVGGPVGGLGGEAGLSAIGRELVQGMDALGVVHDLSHLSWRGMDELFEATDALVIASHSNCSALLERGDREPNQRHLLDAHIREIGRRGGVVGLNLVKFFIKAGIDPKDPADRPTADDAAAHVEHVAQIMGHRRGVGLGSDLDGGITRDDIPAGIDSHEEMGVICDALRRRGWSDAEVRGFAWENWARVLKIPAP